MDDELIEGLADAVHQGWMAEKVSQGFADHAWPAHWRQGIDHSWECDIPIAGHHTDMLPYADLPENVKAYDRATVRAVLRSLEAAGLAIVAISTATKSETPDCG